MNSSQVKGVLLRRSWVAYSVVGGPIRLYLLSTRMKTIGAQCVHNTMHLFSDAQGLLNSVVSGWISLKLKPFQAFVHVLISWKNEEDPIKSESDIECSHFSPMLVYGDFSDAKLDLAEIRTQLSETPWLSFPPARMKKIQSKITLLKCSQRFLHYNPMGISVAMETRVLIRSCPKPFAALPPTQ